MFLLARKRKLSVDSTASDGATPQRKKQPRVNFTAEQKAALRRAYEMDPYPTQPSIDRLANELGIGPRTVINWFHNHRMRYAKQQYAATGIWSVTGAVPVTGKQDPADLDPSSQSCCEDGWDSPSATTDLQTTPVSDTQPASFITCSVEDLSAAASTVASPGTGSGANRRKNTRPQRLGMSDDDGSVIDNYATDKGELSTGVDQLPAVVATSC